MAHEASEQQAANTPRMLSPYLTHMGAWALSIGTSLGWGSMVITSNTYLAEAGPVGSIAGLLVGAAIMLIMSRNYHYMMNSTPDPGGAYAFARETYGYDLGFITAWFLVLTYIAMFWANATALPLFANCFMGDLFRFGFSYAVFGYRVYLGEILLSAGAILFATLLCTRSKAIMQRLMVGMALLFTIGILVCFEASALGGTGIGNTLRPAFVPGSSVFSQILHIAVMSPWAYIGFEGISHGSSEFRFPVKRAFGVLSCSVILSAILYACIILLSVSTVPPEYGTWLDYVANVGGLPGLEGLPAFYAAEHFLGTTGVALLAATLFALVATSLVGNMVALSRLLFAMANDRIIPHRYRELTPRGIPAKAMWLVAGFSLPIMFLGRAAIGWIVDVTTIGATIIFGIVSACTWKMARSRADRADMASGATGFVLMVFFALYLLLFNLISTNSLEAETYFLFTIWTVVGFGFFTVILRKDYAGKFGRSTIVWVSLLLLVLFTSIIWMSQSTMESTRRAMDEVRARYNTQDAAYSLEEQEFMEMELDAVRAANVRSMVIVVVLFGISLGIHLVLQRKHEALEREKMRIEEGSKAKSRFLFNMSHDIRTPMNAIIGFTHLAQQPGVSAAEKDSYLGKIETSGQQLLGIINDVLDMSRIENDKMELSPEPCDLAAAVREVGDLFHTQMGQKDIRFVVDVPQLEDPWVLCDKNRVNRVLLNLLGNAYKFTPEGGEVRLSLEQTVSADRLGSYELRVHDSGIGMSPEFMDNLFTPFERERTATVSSIQGTGLGLSIAKGIVDMMGGTIDVASQPGKGTEFVVRLTFPVAEAPAGELRPQASPVSGAPLDLNEVRLLLVEDNDINMEIAQMILEQEGFEVETADNGKLALDMVAQSEPGHYDAILMDVQMPVMNGYEATRAIRALDNPALASIPIIAMTANVFQEDVRAARSAGMNAHIAKPLDVDTMLATLTSVLTSG